MYLFIRLGCAFISLFIWLEATNCDACSVFLLRLSLSQNGFFLLLLFIAFKNTVGSFFAQKFFFFEYKHVSFENKISECCVNFPRRNSINIRRCRSRTYEHSTRTHRAYCKELVLVFLAQITYIFRPSSFALVVMITTIHRKIFHDAILTTWISCSSSIWLIHPTNIDSLRRIRRQINKNLTFFESWYLTNDLH